MSPTSRSRRPALALIVSLALLAGAACSASGSGAGAPATTEATTTTEDVTAPEPPPTEPEPTTTTRPPTTVTTPAGGTDAGRQAYVDALTADFLADDLEEVGPVAAECVAERWVDIIGMDRIRASGLSADEFGDLDASGFPHEFEVDERRADQLYDAFGACGIDLAATFAELFADDPSVTPEAAACIADTLDDDLLRTVLTAEFTGEEATIDLFDALFACYDL